MTREETIEAIKVMQAYVDGKEIEWNSLESEIFDISQGQPGWNWCELEYRIKEEPRMEVAEGFTAKEVEENFNEKFTQFHVGDYAYSSFHKKEGTVIDSSYGTVSVEFSDKSTVTFGSYHNTPSIHFLSKINKPTGFQKELIEKEPKPWDWRGKNIQWVRSRNDKESIFRTHSLSKEGFSYGHTSPFIYFKSKLIEELEWSSDNDTWRKFE